MMFDYKIKLLFTNNLTLIASKHEHVMQKSNIACEVSIKIQSFEEYQTMFCRRDSEVELGINKFYSATMVLKLCLTGTD